MKKPYEEPVLEITMFTATMNQSTDDVDGVDDNVIVDVGGDLGGWFN